MVMRQDMTSVETEIPGSLMMWQRLSNQVYDYLDGITLAETVEPQLEDTQESLFGTGFQKSAA
jgi:DNA-binding IscR family transcriptional regulator